MARPRSVTIAAANIKVHPHPPGIYPRLLKDAFALKRPIQCRGDQHLVMRPFHDAGDGVLVGSVARFTEIDSELAWFNSETLDVADEENVKSIKIPEGMHPNYVPIFFAFFERSHLFVFETKGKDVSISPNMVDKFLKGLFGQPEIVKTYGQVDVNIVADVSKLDQILGSKAIRKLTIKIRRPNPDTLNVHRDKVMKRLGANNAIGFEQTLIPPMSEALTPDDETKLLARVALTDGEVTAIVGDGDGGRVVPRSTAAHPLVEPHAYDPDALTEQQGFLRGARGLVEKIGRYLAAT